MDTVDRVRVPGGSVRSRLNQWFPLFLISGLSLFLELAVIRWLAGEVRLFSYFKNLPLLAAFLGLAIGFTQVGKDRDHGPTFAPLLTLFILLVLILGRMVSPSLLAYPSGGDEFVWSTAPALYWMALIVFLGMILIFFVLIVLMFIPLGQATGEEMEKFAPIPAYMVNILASLIGVWAFSLVSYFQTPPVVWFGIGIIGVAGYFYAQERLTRRSLALFAGAIVAIGLFGSRAVWSPYHRLELTDVYLEVPDGAEEIQAGYNLSVQQVFYQLAIDLSDQFVAEHRDTFPGLQEMAHSYDLAYTLVPEGSSVLIVGAGMGNDIAAALRNDMGNIDAVEIDPTIQSLGVRLHPERPYTDPRVHRMVDDARSFFNNNRKQYDVVAFGLLDSHTLLSSMSSVRLDSFVYTLESFQQVRNHLKDDGLVVLTFATSAPWIEERLGRMLGEVFGEDQVLVRYSEIGTSFVAGRELTAPMSQAGLSRWQADVSAAGVPLATDDWPYLYLRTRSIPAAYWQSLLLVSLAGLILIRRSFPEALKPDWHFWLLGAAFLLIEFKSITELALLFGTTWLVNALAISGVLVMILLANLFVLRRPKVNLRIAYALLFLSLAVLFLLPLEALSGLPMLWRGILSTTLLSLPLFFAGIIFAESLRRTGETARPLASNLSGTMAGGLLEYGSLIFGIKSLYLVAGILYFGSLLALRIRAGKSH